MFLGGEIYEVYQWPQKMPDGSVKTFEMLRRPDTVMIVALDEVGDVLVIDEKQPGGIVRENHLPVGRIDPSDESVLVAAQRELREKTGYESSEWHLVAVEQPEPKTEWFCYLFLAKSATQCGAPQLDAGERIVTKHVPLEVALAGGRVLRYFPQLYGATSIEEIEAQACN